LLNFFRANLETNGCSWIAWRRNRRIGKCVVGLALNGAATLPHGGFIMMWWKPQSWKRGAS
jgi:hypothetical protein